LAILLALVALLVLRYFFVAPLPPDAREPLAEGSYAVERVVDGDTIVFTPQATVRLIGVDTPETVQPERPVEPWGPEASEFTRAFLARGTARLSFDRERFDRYGRHLAYVWVDGQMLNEELLRAGLARWEPEFRYAEPIKRRFRQAQSEAQGARLGIWSEGAGVP
jgi:micrococcal nuclease